MPRLLLGGITIALLAVLAYMGTMSTASAGAISIDAVPKLLANDAALDDNFGWAVAIDGNSAVVGIDGDGSSGTTPGAAYVFVRTGSTWSQQQKLVALDGANGDQFGVSVAISGDSIVIGANLDDDGGSDSGSAYVFVRTGSNWTEQGKLVASDAAAVDQFGKSVGISGDTVIVGATGDDDFRSGSGSSYIFVRGDGSWSQQQELTASDAAEGDVFGWSVGVSGDSAIAGARFAEDQLSNSGLAYVFDRVGETWSETTKLVASDAGASNFFGSAVAISGDIAIVGAERRTKSAGSFLAQYMYLFGMGVVGLRKMN